MKFRLKSILLIIGLLVSIGIFAQNSQVTQTVRGVVVDKASGSPLSYIAVGLLNHPEFGVTTNDDGQFVLKNVPIGRHAIQAYSVGYESVIIPEVLVTSAKEAYIEIPLKESVYELGEVVVTQQVNKSEPINKMALTGARMLSVEEASRYAGGMDDPARLVSSLAGVSPSVGNNGISIHGNAPSLLQWRLEDIEVPNPNHFSDIATLGGGVLSSLSSNVLGNSDFFIGAFPAEYSNAVSGVFDMKLRNGNNNKYQHSIQAGMLGIDLASEGPFSKKHNASYIFNYRYSTTGLMNKINPGGDLDQILDYQDLNFKLNFPTRKVGIFSIWGTALVDKFRTELDKNTDKWDYKDDAKVSTARQTTAAAGISHRYFFNDNSLLKTTLATTYSKNKAQEDQYTKDLNSTPYLDLKSQYTNLVLNTSFNHKYSSKHTNKTGITYTRMIYDTHMKLAPFDTKPLETISEGDGHTDLLSAYTTSSFDLSNKFSFTLGVNGQLLTLNNNWTLEPRVAFKWQPSSKSSFALAYGLHSRMEKMDVYFVKTKATGDKLVNKDLDFTKAHHIMLSYNYRIADDMNLRIEPYFQQLYDVPVIADSSYSILNRNLFYVEDALVNKGKGRNIGVDITFEKYMTKGLYYMITASVFNSKYCGGDGVWHNTKYNRNFIVNGLIGKEWMVGRSKQNILSVNLKLTVQGGDRYSPVDEQATLAHPDKETQYDETKAYSKQFSPMCLANYTVSYRLNKKKVAHEFAIKSLNATGYKEYYGYEYNIKTGVIEPNRNKTSLMNISYKLDF
jgi:hypothetical protein